MNQEYKEFRDLRSAVTARPVEWFQIAGRYRVSMDRRLGASRFIVLREPGAWERFLDWIRPRSLPQIVAAGLIEDVSPGTSARVIIDDPQRPLSTALRDAIAHRWLGMQNEIRIELARSYAEERRRNRGLT
jgi:hypothetical protein